MSAPTPTPALGTGQSDEKGATACPCGHAVMWHHERRGCGYHGYVDAQRCPCLRTTEEAVRERMAEAWEKGLEAAAEWIAACGRPADIGPPDPPRNPYDGGPIRPGMEADRG